MEQDFRLGPWLVRPTLNSVSRNDHSIRIEPKAMEVLVCLAEAGGSVVSKEKLIAAVWSDTPFVGDDVLTRDISELRRAFEDDAKSPRVIETIPRRGYRLLASVELLQKPRDRSWSLLLRKIAPAVIAVTIALAVYLAFYDKITHPQSVKIRRLTTSGHVGHLAISRDGKYLAYSEEDENAQSLWLRELATATSVQLQLRAPVSYKSLEFSLDGAYLYYVRGAAGAASELFRIPVLGRTPQKMLMDVPDMFSLSPDGKSLAFVRRDRERRESSIIVAGIDGSGEKKLATRHQPTRYSDAGPAWSSDGKLIAAVEMVVSPRFQCRLSIIAVETGLEKIGTTSALQYCLDQIQWVSDGHSLIAPFENPHLQLWEFSYPQLVSRRITYDPLRYSEVSLSADPHSLVAVQLDLPSSIWVGPGNDPDRVSSVKRGHYLGNHGLGWTPSGEILFWTSAVDTQDFVLMRSDGTDERTLPGSTNLVQVEPELCSDGRTLLFDGFNGGTLTLMRSDLSSFKPEPLAAEVSDSAPRCSPDSKWVVYAGSARLWKIPVSGGQSVLLSDEPCESPSISHDGQWITCRYWPEGASSPRLMILTFAGNSRSIALDLPASADVDSSVAWTPDDRAVAFIDKRSGVGNLWVQPITGGPPRALTHFHSEGVLDFSWSRDGKQIVIARGNALSDAVMITNF